MKTATRNGTNQPVATCMRGGSYQTFWIRSKMERWSFPWNCELEVWSIALLVILVSSCVNGLSGTEASDIKNLLFLRSRKFQCANFCNDVQYNQPES